MIIDDVGNAGLSDCMGRTWWLFTDRVMGGAAREHAEAGDDLQSYRVRGIRHPPPLARANE